ncbi:MAG: DNRLRE domain-containing protein, partial [Dehalococcoidia bacterium]
APTDTATNTPTDTPTDTATSTPTDTPTDTATSTPTDTPTPTPVVAKVYVSPEAQTVTSATATVDIVVEGVKSLGGYTINVSWDPSILAYVSATNGSMLGSTGRTVVCGSPSITADSFTRSCTSLGLQGGPDGDGVLATIVFAAVAEGTSPILLKNVQLTHTLPLLHEVTTTDGSVTVVMPTATPAYTPTDTPTPFLTDTPTDTPTSAPTSTPVSASFAPAEDTYVGSDQPTTNYGSDADLIVEGKSNKIRRTFLRFDLSSLPAGSTIVDASLTLCHLGNPEGGAVGHTHELRTVTAAWSQGTVTWNTQPGASGTVTAQLTVPSNATCVTLTVTDDVQAWASGAWNYGWRLNDQDEASNASRVQYASLEESNAALRPVLAVTYIAP